jgi:LAS superfamily LD-carboxypeptidase LdcB
LAEAPSLGWSWELQSEPWHIRYVAGDKTPQRLKELLGLK